ncbi:MAG: hypothetical protein V3W44_02235 [Dehalococcoidales bacterium]
MKEIVDKMVAQVEAREASRAAEDSRLEAELFAEADAAIAAGLGELWDALKPSVSRRVTAHGHSRYKIDGDGLQDLELAPFWVHHDRGSQHDVRLSERGDLKGILAIPVFLASRRRAFHVELERRNREEATDLRDRLTSAVWDPMTPEEAGKVLARLIELYPQDEAEWLEAHHVSQEIRTRWLARQAEAARLAALADEYHTERAEWQQECHAIAEVNAAALEELQKELDGPFVVWRLTYGVIASEEGDTYADLADGYVTADKPDEQGYWTMYSGGLMVRKKFYNPMSTEGPLEFVPSANEPPFLRVGAPCDAPTGARLYAYYDCNTTTRDEVSGLVAARTLPYPPAPITPDGLDEHDVDAAIKRAKEVAENE